MITPEEFRVGWKHFVECINFDQSNLDADAIRFINEVPNEILKALCTLEFIQESKERSSKK